MKDKEFDKMVASNFTLEQIVQMEHDQQTAVLRMGLDAWVDRIMSYGYDPYAVMDALDKTSHDLDQAVGNNEDE